MAAEAEVLAPAPPPRRAALSRPPQPAPRRPRRARQLGAGALGLTLLGLGALAVARLRPRPAAAAAKPHHLRAARRLAGGAAILSTSVLLDSATEHYRGGYINPGMYVAPAVGAASLANSLAMLAEPDRPGPARSGICGFAFFAGIAGTGFHLYNLAKREGGLGLLNLFYGAPLGAPVAIALAGLAGLASERLVVESGEEVTLLGRAAGPVLALGTAGGLLGTVAEAALLHFRGAFHDPFMFLPVTVPPFAALALIAAAFRPELSSFARRLVIATAGLGVIGVGFHIYGVQRNMGGFANWSQNVLQGPPIPTPPAFTGLALAGLAALSLLESA
jgi:hypothetical protein